MTRCIYNRSNWNYILILNFVILFPQKAVLYIISQKWFILFSRSFNIIENCLYYFEKL